MIIKNSTPDDTNEIFRLYEIARTLQKEKGAVLWPEFDKSLIETEILENRQWKILNEGHVACIWSTTFQDPQIWEEQDSDPSIYIHRIATNPAFRGQIWWLKLLNGPEIMPAGTIRNLSEWIRWVRTRD